MELLDEMPTCRSCGGEYKGDAIVPAIIEGDDLMWPATPKQVKFSQASPYCDVKYAILDGESEALWPEEDCCHMCIGL